MRDWLVAVILFVCFNFNHAEPEKEFKIPSYIDLCYRDDPKVSECIKKDIEKLIPIFKNGSKDFDLESLDPMYFDVLDLFYNSSIVGGNLNITDAYVHGLSDSKIKDVRSVLDDPKKFKLNMDVHLPFFNLKCDYHLKGNIIKIPVDIKGRVDMLLEGINLTYDVAGDVKSIEDNDYLVIDKFTWRFLANGIHKAEILNTDLVQGKPALNRLVRTIVNSNWKLLINQMLPAILPESDKKLTSIFKRFFRSYPYDIIFPKSKKDNKVSESDKNHDKDKDKKGDKKEDTKEDKGKDEIEDKEKDKMDDKGKDEIEEKEKDKIEDGEKDKMEDKENNKIDDKEKDQIVDEKEDKMEDEMEAKIGS